MYTIYTNLIDPCLGAKTWSFLSKQMSNIQYTVQIKCVVYMTRIYKDCIVNTCVKTSEYLSSFYAVLVTWMMLAVNKHPSNLCVFTLNHWGHKNDGNLTCNTLTCTHSKIDRDIFCDDDAPQKQSSLPGVWCVCVC